MTDFIILAAMILGAALVGDIVERILRKQQIDAERVIDLEGDDNMEYVELNGELIPYNEEDQE